jgi:hypothetical protein
MLSFHNVFLIPSSLENILQVPVNSMQLIQKEMEYSAAGADIFHHLLVLAD